MWSIAQYNKHMNNTYTPCTAAVGDRIELGEMVGEDLPRGLCGTIIRIAEIFSGEQDIAVTWDNGSHLSLIYPLDDFKVLGKV
jgi:hypothetical protein